MLLQGYVVRISGGNDKQGFPMKQGVLTTGRVRLLLSKGHSCYRPRRTGERKRKSVRGCIVDANLSVLNLVIVKKGNVLYMSHYLDYLFGVTCKGCMMARQQTLLDFPVFLKGGQCVLPE